MKLWSSVNPLIIIWIETWAFLFCLHVSTLWLKKHGHYYRTALLALMMMNMVAFVNGYGLTPAPDQNTTASFVMADGQEVTAPFCMSKEQVAILYSEYQRVTALEGHK